MMPLSMAQMGEKMIIKQINGKDETRHFLESLGFVTGGSVMVILQMSGNMIVSIKNVRVAISKSMATRIMVKDEGGYQ